MHTEITAPASQAMPFARARIDLFIYYTTFIYFCTKIAYKKLARDILIFQRSSRVENSFNRCKFYIYQIISFFLRDMRFTICLHQSCNSNFIIKARFR